MSERDEHSETVSIGPKLIASGGFESLYQEGMSLIEEVAAYLDGPGRNESRDLPREAGFVYATESMRLTTRLMQLASWLLLQRAVVEGEITPEDARTEKAKVKFSSRPVARGGPGWDELPTGLKSFMERGDNLFGRVQQMDKLDRGVMRDCDSAPVAGDIADQFSRLQSAFKFKK